MPEFGIIHDHTFSLVLTIVFVVLNGFFVAAEFALVKVRATFLEVLVKKGNTLAKLAFGMVKHLDAYLSVTQLGITLASLGLGWIGEPALADLFHGILVKGNIHISDVTLHSISFAVAFILLSGLHIVVGELVPKSIAIRVADKIILLVALPMRFFYIIFFPFMWILNGISNTILKIIRIPPAGGPARAHSEEEIKLIVEDSFEEGAIGPRKRLLLDKAIDFSHKKVHNIMIPADKMVCFYVDDPVRINIDKAMESGHTRFPLIDTDKKKILGFIHMKDIIWNLEHEKVINLFDLRRPILSLDVDMGLDAALRRFQNAKIHIAIVEDVHGNVQGLVTLEDVIEQIVGEIEDEFE